MNVVIVGMMAKAQKTIETDEKTHTHNSKINKKLISYLTVYFQPSGFAYLYTNS